MTSAIEEKKWSDETRNLFEILDLDKDGLVSEEEYINGWGLL